MRNRREAIIEFIRVNLDDPNVLNESLTRQFDNETKYDLKEVQPYNQADMYLHHCDMLIKFANIDDEIPR